MVEQDFVSTSCGIVTIMIYTVNLILNTVTVGSECLLNYWANLKSRCCFELDIPHCLGQDTKIFGHCSYDCLEGEYYDRDYVNCPIIGVMSILISNKVN